MTYSKLLKTCSAQFGPFMLWIRISAEYLRVSIASLLRLIIFTICVFSDMVTKWWRTVVCMQHSVEEPISGQMWPPRWASFVLQVTSAPLLFNLGAAPSGKMFSTLITPPHLSLSWLWLLTVTHARQFYAWSIDSSVFLGLGTTHQYATYSKLWATLQALLQAGFHSSRKYVLFLLKFCTLTAHLTALVHLTLFSGLSPPPLLQNVLVLRLARVETFRFRICKALED